MGTLSFVAMLTVTGTDFFGDYLGTVALVTAEHAGTRNVMAAGWHTALSQDPPLYGVVVNREHATYPLIRRSGRFGVNFLPFSEARRIQGSGVLSQLDGHDKFERLGLDTLPDIPLALALAYQHYTCEVTQVVPTGDHDLFVGEVTLALEDSAFFDDEHMFAGQAAIYLGRSYYVTTTQERRQYLPAEYD